MLQTTTPDAQLDSIPASAVSPPRLTPYPIDVGTAMTGAATMPPTTLGSAPSIPATTTTTLVRSNTSRLWSSR